MTSPRYRSPVLHVAPLFASLCLACAVSPSPEIGQGAAPRPAREAGTVLLVSIDGFRPDYLDPATTPNLLALAARGARAEMIPAFPTKTFPNHYSIVTGLRPDAHGLVANNIWDPEMEDSYSLSDREAVGDAAWYGGEPVWVTAERLGIPTAPLFWPGSEAPIGELWPTHWKPYDGEMPYRDRVDWVLDRLDGRAGAPVRFATVYFDAVDTVGHRYGPDAPETRAAAAHVDSVIGYLVDGLDRRGLSGVNLIVVSDHGMSPLSPDRVIFLDDLVDLETVRVVDWSPVLAIWPGEGGDAALESARGALEGLSPHLHVYRREEIPECYELGSNERVAPLIAIADPGWSITTRAFFDRNVENFSGGNHGYNQWSADMRALFVAAGPAFRRGVVVEPFRSFDVYPLMMRILGLSPRPGDWQLERVAGALAPDLAKAR